MIYGKIRFSQITGFLLTIIALTCTLMIHGCGDDNSTGSVPEGLEGAKVVIEPQDISFEVDEEQEFSAFVISATGDTLNEDFDFSWNWYSSNANVFTVETNGTAYGKSTGEAYCVVEASTGSSKITAKLRYVGLDSAFVSIF